MQHGNKPIAEWIEEVNSDLTKVLNANSPVGVMVCVRERVDDTLGVGPALVAIQGVLPTQLNKMLLVVLLSPPTSRPAVGCTAHGVIHCPDGKRTQLRTVSC